MATGYNSAALLRSLSEAVAMDPKLQGDIYSKVIDAAATQHNAFTQFTSTVSAKTGMFGGIKSIFAMKQDLAAGGSSTVNFNVIGTPGGAGVMGNQELTGNTSTAKMATYGVRVGWFRDAFELDLEGIEMLTAGRSLVEVSVALLAKKMGILRQNVMMMRLIKAAKRAVISTGGTVTGQGNIYRPGGRGTLDGLLNTDVMTLSIANNCRARVRSLGATPLMRDLSATGSPIDGYLMFLTDQGMLSIRNDTSFTTAISQASERGDNQNQIFTGELLKWSGMPWYEYPLIDESWDDYIGGPMLAKAKIAVAFNSDTSKYALYTGETATLYLRASSATVPSTGPTIGAPRYFQFFDGYDYKFTNDQVAATNSDLTANPAETGNTYYAWACNPDGTYAFLSFTGSDNMGTFIRVKNILATAAGSSTLGALSVGNFFLGTTPTTGTVNGLTRIITRGTGSPTLPLAFSGNVLTDRVDVGAILYQANANGNIIGRGFVFGAMAACYANGRINMDPIEQKRDYGFVFGRGFQTILGAGVTKTPNQVIGGYLLLEHVVKPEGVFQPYFA